MPPPPKPTSVAPVPHPLTAIVAKIIDDKSVSKKETFNFEFNFCFFFLFIKIDLSKLLSMEKKSAAKGEELDKDGINFNFFNLIFVNIRLSLYVN